MVMEKNKKDEKTKRKRNKARLILRAMLRKMVLVSRNQLLHVAVGLEADRFFVAYACTSLSNLSDGRENAFLNGPLKEEVYVAQPHKLVDPDHPKKSVPSKESSIWIKISSESLFPRIHKDGDGDALFQLKSDSLPHAHAQTTKTYYKHRDSRIMKAQELKTKTSAQTLIYKIFLQRYQVYQGRLLASFQDDAKYEHVGQDTRSQGGKDDQDGRIKI
ncbi:hypothetical protein Tco_1315890 [Tanacetum coccineum]